LAAAALPAVAHRTNAARLELRLDREPPSLTIDLSAHDLAAGLGAPVDAASPVPTDHFDAQADTIARWAGTRIALVRGGAPCPAHVERQPIGDDSQRLRLAFECPRAGNDPGAGAAAWILRYRLFADIDPAHVASGSAVLPGGAREDLLFEGRFDTHRGQAGAVPAAAASSDSAWSRAAGLSVLGVEHIVFGADHVLFVVALVITCTGAWALLKTVTAFTIGHSLTLALAWFGLLRLPAAPVELAIALSIAVVAGRGLAGAGAERLWLLAGAFGLVHGLGFYGALDPAISREGAALALAAFNVGVEAGQLLVVTPLALVLWRVPALRAAARRWGNLAILGAALWWSAARVAAL
jgi:hypothetical protein